MIDFIVTTEKINQAKPLIEDSLITAGVQAVILIDGAGNTLLNCGQGLDAIDTISLAPLVAANFQATNLIAQAIGEDDFSLVFHKGKKDSIHFSHIGENLILIVIFGEEAGLGLLRHRITQLAPSIRNIFEE